MCVQSQWLFHITVAMIGKRRASETPHEGQHSEPGCEHHVHSEGGRNGDPARLRESVQSDIWENIETRLARRFRGTHWQLRSDAWDTKERARNARKTSRYAARPCLWIGEVPKWSISNPSSYGPQQEQMGCRHQSREETIDQRGD